MAHVRRDKDSRTGLRDIHRTIFFSKDLTVDTPARLCEESYLGYKVCIIVQGNKRGADDTRLWISHNETDVAAKSDGCYELDTAKESCFVDDPSDIWIMADDGRTIYVKLQKLGTGV